MNPNMGMGMSRIHLRLILVFFVVMLMVGTMSALLVHVLMRPEIEKQARILLNEIAENLSTGIAAHWQEPLSLPPAICKKVKRTGVYLNVKDIKGNRLASAGDPVNILNARRFRFFLLPNITRLKVEQAIIKNGIKVGSLTLAPSAAWHRKVSKRRRLVPVLLSAGLVIAALLLWPLSRGLTRRLTALVEVSDRLAQGDLSVRADVKGKDEIDRLALRFNRMAQTLEKQRTARRNFFRAISHEIRSPLARIRVALDILAESDSKKEKKDSIASAQAGIDEIDSLTGRMLDAARGADISPAIKIGPVDLIALAHAMAKPYGLALKTSCRTAIIKADPEVLSRALRNIFENVSRYAPADKSVSLELIRAKGMVKIFFRDYGPGIQEDETERIFEPFYRLDKDHGGAGLGLSIVRQAVEQLNGRVHAEAAKGGGAVIVISLPD